MRMTTIDAFCDGDSRGYRLTDSRRAEMRWETSEIKIISEEIGVQIGYSLK